MKSDQEFLLAIFNELYTKNLEQYKKSLTKPLNNENDPFAKIRNALATLSERDRANIFAFFNVIIADSASVVLGVLDGVHFPDGIDGDFVATCHGEEIQGDLLDIFIEKAQEINVYG